MASTYSSLKIQLMATGENSGTWGSVTNVNLGTALEEAIVGSEDVTFASGNVTLTLTDTNASQTARNLRLNLVGTTGGARDLIVPAIEKIYIVNNTCADAVTIKVSGQTGVAVPAGKTMYVYNNGTDCGDAITHLRSLTLATALPPGSGGTGLNTVGTAGNVLTSNGTAWVSQAAATTTNASALTTGTTAVNVGGTGQTTYTNGQLLIGNTTGNTLAKNTLTAGTGIGITNGAGAITINCNVVGGGGFSGSTGFNSPGNFTAPPTTNQVYVVLQAGGGGGGGSNGVVPGGAGGGGGAAMGVVPVTGGSSYPVTVGSGGNGGSTPGGSGNAGGASSFSNLISANGGGAGTGAPSPESGGTPGAGGNGVAPTGIALAGQAGGSPGVNNQYSSFGGSSAFGVGANRPTGATRGGGGYLGYFINPPAVNGTAGGAGFVFVAY
jgi:hypothetical protein